ncbi:MAG: hypothetical protein LBE75_00920 [Burkholderiales bacterium]|nr:hypothetical protein [Burkholderiales bacterium]
MFSRAFSRISFLLAIFAAVLMAGCGGGSGSPSDEFRVRLNETKMAYGPIKLDIDHGRAPFEIWTNSTGVVFPEERTNARTVYGFVKLAAEDGTGVVFVRDSNGRIESASFAWVALNLEPSSLTVTPIGNPQGCGAGQSGDYAQICAGTQGIAELQLNGIGVGNETVQFNVVQGDYQLQAGSGSPWGTSAVTVTDSGGKAQATIQAKSGVPTQMATINAKGGGISINTSFVIVSPSLAVLPGTASWTSPTATCPLRTATFGVYGGTPPYAVFTTLGTVSPSTVSAIGGTVTLTVAECGNGSLTVRDAVGNTATASIGYTASSSSPPPSVLPPVTTPVGGAAVWGTSAARVSCVAGSTFTFTVMEGTSPYEAFTVPAGPNPTVTVSGSVGQVVFSAAPPSPSTFAVYVVDKDGKQSTTTPTIYCN